MSSSARAIVVPAGRAIPARRSGARAGVGVRKAPRASLARASKGFEVALNVRAVRKTGAEDIREPWGGIDPISWTS